MIQTASFLPYPHGCVLNWGSNPESWGPCFCYGKQWLPRTPQGLQYKPLQLSETPVSWLFSDQSRWICSNKATLEANQIVLLWINCHQDKLLLYSPQNLHLGNLTYFLLVPLKFCCHLQNLTYTTDIGRALQGHSWLTQIWMAPTGTSVCHTSST